METQAADRETEDWTQTVVNDGACLYLAWVVWGMAGALGAPAWLLPALLALAGLYLVKAGKFGAMVGRLLSVAFAVVVLAACGACLVVAGLGGYWGSAP